MEPILFNNRKYYHIDSIIECYSNLNNGCRTKIDLVRRHEIPTSSWLHARFKNGEWIISDGSSTKVDKIFISINC